MTEPMSDERLAEIAAEQRLAHRDKAWHAIDDLMAERVRLARELRTRGRRHEMAEARAEKAEAALARVTDDSMAERIRRAWDARAMSGDRSRGIAEWAVDAIRAAAAD